MAAVFHISRDSTRKYVRLFQSSGKSMEELLAMTEEQLRQELGQGTVRHSRPSEHEIELEALLPEYAKQLTRKGMSKARLYEQYHAAYPDGYGLTMFKQALRQYLHQSKVVGHVEHYAGDQMYIDFAGDRLEVVDCMTGETKKAEVFVAILPFSHYTYCEAVWSQRKGDLIKGCEGAMQYFGSVPAAIVPDNLKAAVSRSDRNEKTTAGRNVSRVLMLNRMEKDLLRPLPERSFTVKERKLMTIGKNCYVSLFKHHYSVPGEHVGKRVVILYDADTVEIYCGLNLVAVHDRCDIPYACSWKREHNLPGHYGAYDKDLEELFVRAGQIDNIVFDYLREVDRHIQYPPKTFSSCHGIIALEKKYGADRLIAACACAGMKAEYGYQALPGARTG